MKPYRVKPAGRLSLKEHDPDDTGDYKKNDAGKAAAKAETEKHIARVRQLQERLYGNNSRALLIVLQGMDTSGKGGTVRHVLGQVDPSDALVESLITTVDESRAVEARLREANTEKSNRVAMEKFGPAGPGPFSKRPKDHIAREEELKDAVSAASDQHIATNWTTYLEKPPGGEAAHTLKARYEEFLSDTKAASPQIVSMMRSTETTICGSTSSSARTARCLGPPR